MTGREDPRNYWIVLFEKGGPELMRAPDEESLRKRLARSKGWNNWRSYFNLGDNLEALRLAANWALMCATATTRGDAENDNDEEE